MSSKTLIVLATLGSGALMLGALGFQYIGGMAPCHLCYLERYPHVAAVLIGLLALAMPWRGWAALGALAAASTSALGLYHTGVERGWWEGPASCTSQSIEGLSTDALMDQIMSAPVVLCDTVAWQMFGLSMASWNAIASLVLVFIWLAALRKG